MWEERLWAEDRGQREAHGHGQAAWCLSAAWSFLFGTRLLEPEGPGFMQMGRGCLWVPAPAALAVAQPRVQSALRLTPWPSLRSALSRCGADGCARSPGLVTPRGQGHRPVLLVPPWLLLPPLLGLWHSALGRQGQGHGQATWGLTWRLPGSGPPRHPFIPEVSCPQIL